jgi:tRNA A-37 threonylcarbamoyl transferase component Bud32
MVPHPPPPGNAPSPQSVPLASGRATAVCDPAVAGGVARLLAQDVAAWPDAGLERIKQRTVRSVFRGELDGVPVYVKVFRPDTLVDKVRDLVRADRGRAEHRHLAAIGALGLPVVTPLAHGFASEGRHLRSFVVTAAAPGATFDFATASAAAQAAAGALLRRLHDAGVKLDDLHPGNLLVGPDDAPRLLDLTSVRRGERADVRERARGLARFCAALDGGALDPSARAFLAGYLAAGALPAAFRAAIAAEARRHRAAALASFGRRAFRECAHTATADRRRAVPRWFWRLPNADATARAACATFAEAPPTPAKSGRRGAVWLLPDLVAKERDAGAAQKLWRAAYWLAFAGVDAPAAVALRLHGGRGVVFSRRVGQPSLADELRAAPPTAAAACADARRLGGNVGRLHAHGLGNRDLKFENLVRDPATGALAMVDLDGVRRHAVEDARGRGADLGRLLAAFDAAGRPGGAAAVRAFLRGYLRAHRCLHHAPPLRRLVRRAAERAGQWASAHR